VLKVEKLLGVGNLYDAANIEFNHHVQQACARTSSTSATAITW